MQESEQQCAAATALAEPLQAEDDSLIAAVMQLARHAVRQLSAASFQAVSDATAPPNLIRLAEEVVVECLGLPEDKVKVWAKDQPWQLDGPAPMVVDWHLSFRKLQRRHQAHGVDTGRAIAELDVVDLGVKHLEAVTSITERFSEAVAEEDFVLDQLDGGCLYLV